MIAWAIAVVVGGVAGLLVALNATVASWASATVDLFRSLPVIALIPIAILIWGTGTKTEIILGAYAGIWPMLINTAGGARSVPPRLLEVAQTLQLSRAATLLKVVMPVDRRVDARRRAPGAGDDPGDLRRRGDPRAAERRRQQLVLEQRRTSRRGMWAYVLVIGCLGILVNFALVRLVRILFPGVAAASERSAA